MNRKKRGGGGGGSFRVSPSLIHSHADVTSDCVASGSSPLVLGIAGGAGLSSFDVHIVVFISIPMFHVSAVVRTASLSHA